MEKKVFWSMLILLMLVGASEASICSDLDCAETQWFCTKIDYICFDTHKDCSSFCGDEGGECLLCSETEEEPEPETVGALQEQNEPEPNETEHTTSNPNYYFTKLEPNEEITAKLARLEFGLSEIKFYVNNKAENVIVNVTELDLPREELNMFENGEIYSEFEISSNLLSSNIREASIFFQIDSFWFDSNDLDVDTVSLYRYTDSGWTKLDSQLIESTGWHYFKSPTSGFGKYLIFAEEAQNEPELVQEAEPEEEDSSGDRRVFSKELFNKLITAAIFLIGVVLGSLLLVLFSKKPKSKFSGKYVKIKQKNSGK